MINIATRDQKFQKFLFRITVRCRFFGAVEICLIAKREKDYKIRQKSNLFQYANCIDKRITNGRSLP